MYYGYTTLATNWTEKEMNNWKIRLTKSLLFFIPRANPDQEKLYPQVAKWLIEIDDKEIPSREIGLDKHDNPLFAAPNERNYGFWTDSSEAFKKADLKPVDQEYFEAMWSRATRLCEKRVANKSFESRAS